MDSRKNGTVFDLLLMAKNVAKSLSNFTENSDEMLAAKNSILQFNSNSDTIVHQLLIRQEFYLQFKYYVFEKLASLPIPMEDILSSTKDQTHTFNIQKQTDKIFPKNQVLSKIESVQEQTIEIAQQLNLLELMEQISEENMEILDKLSLKKMVIYLLEHENQLPQKLFLKPFLLKIMITASKIKRIFNTIIVLIEDELLQKKDKQEDLFRRKSKEEIQRKTKKGMSSLTTSLQSFIEKRQNEGTSETTFTGTIKRKEYEINTEFSMRKRPEKKGKRERLKEKLSGCFFWN